MTLPSAEEFGNLLVAERGERFGRQRGKIFANFRVHPPPRIQPFPRPPLREQAQGNGEKGVFPRQGVHHLLYICEVL